MYLHAALITTLNVIVIAVAMMLVGRARSRYKISAPATTGNLDFERVFRAHQNTLEATVMFLPVLWIATIYQNETYAAWLGYAWVVGRFWYIYGYVRAGGSRGAPFTIAVFANSVLLCLALWGVIHRLAA